MSAFAIFLSPTVYGNAKNNDFIIAKEKRLPVRAMELTGGSHKKKTEICVGPTWCKM